MPPGLRSHGQVPTPEQFSKWAAANEGVDSTHHYHPLLALSPYLHGRNKILDIGSEPGPWLNTLAQFAGNRHEFFGARQGGIGPAKCGPIGSSIFPVELDIWSPLGDREISPSLRGNDYSIVTALGLTDRMYHPDPLFRAASEALAPGGTFLISVTNVARFERVLGLIRGIGVAGDLDAMIGRQGRNVPRPIVREYCWQELTGAAINAGFSHLSHVFYDDPAGHWEAGPFTEPLHKALIAFLQEPGQLQTHLILIFRKPGQMTLKLHSMRQALLREAHFRYTNVKRSLKNKRKH